MDNVVDHVVQVEVLEDVVVEGAESKAGMPKTCETAFKRSARDLVVSQASSKALPRPSSSRESLYDSIK